MSTFAEYAFSRGFTVISLEAITDDHVVSAIHRFYRSNAYHLSTSTVRGSPLVLDIHLLETNTFRASAGTFDDGDAIVLSRGVLKLLLTLSRAVVGWFKPSVGYATSITFIGGPAYMVANPTAYTLGPKNTPEQEQFAQQIFEYAVLYIMNHEFAHILSGHTRWINQRKDINRIIKAGTINGPKIAGLELETLEWDADCFAIQAGLVEALQPKMEEVGGRARWSLDMSLEPGPYPEPFVAMMAGTFICALLLAATGKGDVNDTTPGRYPHPAIRFHLIVNQLIHVVAYRTGSDPALVLERFGRVISAIAVSWSAIFGQTGLDAKITDQATRDAMLARIEEYTATWAVLRPQLDCLKLGGILAPAQPMRHPAYPDFDYYG